MGWSGLVVGPVARVMDNLSSHPVDRPSLYTPAVLSRRSLKPSILDSFLRPLNCCVLLFGCGSNATPTPAPTPTAASIPSEASVSGKAPQGGNVKALVEPAVEAPSEGSVGEPVEGPDTPVAVPDEALLPPPTTRDYKTFLDYCKGPANSKEQDVVDRLMAKVSSNECPDAYKKLQGLSTLELTGISTVAPLAGLDSLLTLDISFNKKIRDIQALSSLINLKNLKMRGHGVASLDALRPLTRLETLDASSRSLKDIRGVKSLTRLVSLALLYAKDTDLTPLSKLPALRVLTLGENRKLVDLSPLSDIGTLEELRITESGVRTLAAVTALPKLRLLSVFAGVGVKDVDGLAEMSVLEDLTIHLASGAKLPKLGAGLIKLHIEHSALRDLTPLAGATGVDELYLGDNLITSIEPLRGLTKLQMVRLSENKITDLSPLAGKPLKHMDIGEGNKVLKDEAHCPSSGSGLLAAFCTK